MKITDDMLFEHIVEARDIWLSTLPANGDIPEFQVSKAFEEKIKRLIKEQNRTQKVNRLRHYMKQIAASVLVVATISLVGMMTVEACRVKVIEIVTHVFNELTDYRFSSEMVGTNEFNLPDISFEYVPEGMLETEDTFKGNDRRYILYESNDGAIFSLTQRAISPGGSYGSILDTEDATYETIYINGNEVYVKEKPYNNDIIWTVDNIVYHLYGNISMTELQKIAEKMILSEN